MTPLKALIIIGVILYLGATKQALAIPGGLVYPLMDTKVASDFGKRRHPIARAVKHHNGIDLAAPYGSPVRAVKEGIVIFADFYGAYGNLVTIKHGPATTTHYGHLMKIKVKPGQKIKAGDIIGLVGSTGLSTGPHLHFEIRVNGKPHDPRRVIPDLAANAEG
ncbi:MAG TPA: M23 family metallopeptidase [Oligoflexia bacterium]|nr:M23 family metallopeptidase [Oligoflexia bacterium]HMP27825.1 M23 family metallopeptidase [Oligoflexia bacterium]